MSTTIPQPWAIPFVGNVHLIEYEVPLNSFMLLAKQYGSIYQLKFPGNRTGIIVSGLELVDELCDQKRFHKNVTAALEQLRNLAADGLFTAFHGEENWGIAHRILMPAFGPAKIRGMFHQMTDICDQLIKKWERFGPDYVIEPAEDFTRLTFDTISLCTMSYRQNSYYTLDNVPFVTSMVRFLIESGQRAIRPTLVQKYFSSSVNAQYEEDRKVMMDLAHKIIKKRKESAEDVDDLLGLMLTAKDEVTGLGLSDESIAYNLVTFLIAGHETTSGLLSFALYHLLANPSAYANVRAEVDEVLGKKPIELEHISKLKYLNAVLRETLRITPPVWQFMVEAFEETIIGTGDKTYRIPPNVTLMVLSTELHRNTRVWGEDSDLFRPERMLDGGFERAPRNAWKPFGNGARGCIGRAFAWQEVLIALASIFQRFDLVLDNPSYELHLKAMLTVKPADFRIRAIVREGAPVSMHTGVGAGSRVVTPTQPSKSMDSSGMVPLYLAYGSNSGTCKDFAQRLASEAPSKGFLPQILTLDSLAPKLPTDGPLVVLTASYEGEPADNAGQFVERLKRAHQGEFENIQFTVFGCGSREWPRTYQKIPTLVDELLSKFGGKRLLKRTAADSSSDDFFDTFDSWLPRLWNTLDKVDQVYNVLYDALNSPCQAFEHRTNANNQDSDTLSIEHTSTTRVTVLGRNEAAALGTVVDNRILTAPGAPRKHHIEISLPPPLTYRAGDYLTILPSNPPESVRRVIARFGLLSDQQIIIKSNTPTTLPTDIPISVSELLAGYVEISQPATQKNIKDLIIRSPNSVTTRKLQRLAENYKTAVLDKHLSVLDILELSPEFDLPLSTFLRYLPAMRLRQYSISSSPLWRPDHVTLTLSILETSKCEGPGRFFGVASNYLANLRPGDRIQVGVRKSAVAFQPPVDMTVPIVMFATGSGLAPMRGFIQERAIQVAAGRDVGKAILFYGCRSPDEDYIYANDDLKTWSDASAVEVRPTFSRATTKSSGLKYVQDRVWHDRKDIIEAYKSNAKFYTCGTSQLASSIREVMVRILQDAGVTDVEAEYDRFQKDRMATDVFT